MSDELTPERREWLEKVEAKIKEATAIMAEIRKIEEPPAVMDETRNKRVLMRTVCGVKHVYESLRCNVDMLNLILTTKLGSHSDILEYASTIKTKIEKKMEFIADIMGASFLEVEIDTQEFKNLLKKVTTALNNGENWVSHYYMETVGGAVVQLLDSLGDVMRDMAIPENDVPHLNSARMHRAAVLMQLEDLRDMISWIEPPKQKRKRAEDGNDDEPKKEARK